MSKSYARTKKKFISTAVGSFIGIMAAIPVAMGIYNPGIIAGATQEQNADSSAKVSGIPADFAQFAYAYSQGYAAKATSTATGSSATAGSACAESTVSTGGSGQVLGDSTSKPQADLGGVINSYNEYKSFVYNSSTSMITNSNNTVGSNNTTKTDIEVKDSEKLSIDVDNKTDVTNIATDNSFNNESYNTKTETENVAVTKVEDSYNTKTENVAVNKVDGSYNTATKTETTSVDVDKTETNEATFNSDSNNTTTTTVGDIKDNELEIETDLSNPFPKN